MAVDVELVGRHRVEHLLRHLRRRDLARADGLVDHGPADQLAAGRLFSLKSGRPVALTLADSCRHEVRAQHAGADLVADKTQVLIQRFAQRHHRMLADVVNAHIGRVEQAGHAGGVDDMALPRRVFRRRVEHHRREQANTVDDAPQIDAEHPLPVLDGVFPDQPARADAGVVEDEMRRAEMLEHRPAHRFHLPGVRDVEPE